MALLLEFGRVSPIPPNTDPRNCSGCGSQNARWLIRLADGGEPWCAKCFLYNTQWGKDNATHRDLLIKEVEKKMELRITDNDGVLTEDGADRILMSAVMLAAYRAGVGRAKGHGA